MVTVLRFELPLNFQLRHHSVGRVLAPRRFTGKRDSRWFSLRGIQQNRLVEVVSPTNRMKGQENPTPQHGRIQLKNSKPNSLTVITITKGLKRQVKEKQKQKNTTTGEGSASDPGRLRGAVVVAGGDDVVCALAPPPQHARVTIACAIEVGELEHTHKGDVDSIATRDQYRQPT